MIQEGDQFKIEIYIVRHPSPRNPKYQKWMPMESVNAECLDMVYVYNYSNGLTVFEK